MTDMVPILFVWTDDGVMRPLDRFLPRCDKQFVVGEVYRLGVEEERSMASHRQYFASINEAWKNLPDLLSRRFPTPEKLRKWCLVECGYATEQFMVCRNDVEAARWAALLGKMNEDAIIETKGNTIKVSIAKSQSVRHMNKEEFQASKVAVLDKLAETIGVTTEELTQNAGRAA